MLAHKESHEIASGCDLGLRVCSVGPRFTFTRSHGYAARLWRNGARPEVQVTRWILHGLQQHLRGIAGFPAVLESGQTLPSFHFPLRGDELDYSHNDIRVDAQIYGPWQDQYGDIALRCQPCLQRRQLVSIAG